MTSGTAVRVVCVTYHPGPELEDFAESLRAATASPTELVIVDNGADHTVADDVARRHGARLVVPGATSATGPLPTWAPEAPVSRGSSWSTPTSCGTREPSTCSSRPASGSARAPSGRCCSTRTARRTRPHEPSRHWCRASPTRCWPGCGPRTRGPGRTTGAPGTGCPKGRSARPTGCPARACCCAGRRSRPSAASTRATSCSSRTSTLVSGWAGAAGQTCMRRRPG